jgi:hypothetical protein
MWIGRFWRLLLQTLSINLSPSNLSERIWTLARPKGSSTTLLYKHAILLGLPVELRIIIFHLVLDDAHLKVRCGGIRFRRHEMRNAWSSLQICRQIRLEIKQVFFETVTFSLPTNLTERKLREWLATIGPTAASNIRKLQFYCENRCTLFGLQSGLVAASVAFINWLQ